MTNVMLTVKSAPGQGCKHHGPESRDGMHAFSACVKKAVEAVVPEGWDVVVTLNTETMHG